MSKFWLGLMATIVLFVGAIGFIPAEIGAEGFSNVKLTEEQKKEMSSLQKRAFEQKKEIINKYVEYGVFTEEKGQKIISHLEKAITNLNRTVLFQNGIKSTENTMRKIPKIFKTIKLALSVGFFIVLMEEVVQQTPLKSRCI